MAIVSVRATGAGTRVVRWDGSGAAPTELDALGTDGVGQANCEVGDINSGGDIVGASVRYAGNTQLGFRAVRWNAGGTAATELDALESKSDGSSSSHAYGVNDAGIIVGSAEIYSGSTTLGLRAVRWNAAGRVTELGALVPGSEGGNSVANAINRGGTIVGYSQKTNAGNRAVRWEADASVATELGTIVTEPSLPLTYGNYANHYAYALNDAGTVIGYAEKIAGGAYVGTRPVRWDAGGTAATELDNLGTSLGGYTLSATHAINASGTTVGYAQRWDSAGNSLGDRAIRWDAGSPVAHVLVGTSTRANASSNANGINTAGIIVGSALMSVGASDLSRAVAWNPDGTILDLNTLLSPAEASVWNLSAAYGISDTNWVTGVGFYRGDASIPQGYLRAFLIQLPEPTGLAGLVGMMIGVSRRRRLIT